MESPAASPENSALMYYDVFRSVKRAVSDTDRSSRSSRPREAGSTRCPRSTGSLRYTYPPLTVTPRHIVPLLDIY